MKTASIVSRWAIIVVLVPILNLLATPAVHAEWPCGYPTCFQDYDGLMQYLQGSGRRDPEYRILQARHGQPTLVPRHRQYDIACYYFALAPVLEYLGYSRFEQGAHLYYPMRYPASDGMHRHNLDAGYYLSAEHLMGMSVRYETLQNLCQYRGGWDCDPIFETEFYSSAAKTSLNTSANDCTNTGTKKFDPGQEYGMCSPLPNTYEQWLNALSNGCGKDQRCSCTLDSSCGSIWFGNQVLNRAAGCNDMRVFQPSTNTSSSTEITHMRRVIKAFVDHNLPLVVTVRNGGHFMVLIGYLELDANGLPRKGILTDGDGRYRILSLSSGWGQAINDSLQSVYPWNHHFDEACESGGWAAELDRQSSKFKLCSMPRGWTGECSDDRAYSARVICQDNGSSKATYFAHDGDLFISDDDNVSCDKVLLHYSDAQRTVRSATIQRSWYSPAESKWISGQVYRPDVLRTGSPGSGRSGPLNMVEWDAAWPEDYWLIADGLDGTYSKRRATIELSFDDGTTEKIELSPPHTYGIAIDCINDGAVTKSYQYEADHGVFRATGPSFEDKQFFYESADRSCDAISVRVNLGQGETVVGAQLQRYYYTLANGEWRPAQGAWLPDRNAMVLDGLTGYSREYTWDAAWLENQWLAADDVGAGSSRGDRKTVLRLYDGSMNLLREVEVVPY